MIRVLPSQSYNLSRNQSLMAVIGDSCVRVPNWGSDRASWEKQNPGTQLSRSASTAYVVGAHVVPCTLQSTYSSAMYCSIQNSSRFSGTLSLNGYDRQAFWHCGRPGHAGVIAVSLRSRKATRLTLTVGGQKEQMVGGHLGCREKQRHLHMWLGLDPHGLITPVAILTCG